MFVLQRIGIGVIVFEGNNFACRPNARNKTLKYRCLLLLSRRTG